MEGEKFNLMQYSISAILGMIEESHSLEEKIRKNLAAIGYGEKKC